VRIEASDTGWDVRTTAASPRESQESVTEDIGRILLTLIGDEATPTTVDAGATTSFPPSGHDEATEHGLDSLPAATGPTEPAKPNIWRPTPVTNNGQTLTPMPATKVIIGSQTLTPGGETATIGEGGATKVHINENGAPVVVIAGSTSTGQLSSALSQVFTIGDFTATAEATDLRYVVASSTLAVGQSVTVSGTIVALTTDATGATVLVAGDSTTTLASPSQAAAMSHDSGVTTTIVDGMTQYIIESQTLAPGHPVTIDGTPISIATVGNATVLVVGDATTTLSNPGTSESSATNELAVATSASLAGSGGGPVATSTSKTAGTGRLERGGVATLCVIAFGLTILSLG
jgi:hypothetical protein